MSKSTVVFVNNSSGLSFDDKLGPKGSFGYSQHIDFRKSPTKMTILPKATKETSTTVTDMITAMVRLPSGKLVGIGDTGGVYSRSTSAVWTKDGSTLTNTAFGAVYNLQQDRIFVPGTTAIHTIDNADGRFGGSFTPTSNTFVHNSDYSILSGVSNYTTLGAISEVAADKKAWTPNVDPLYSVKLQIVTKGTGDLTVTIHDSANNVLGTKLIANASLVNGTYAEFIFTTPLRVLARPTGAEYHIHVTHSGGTASTVGTTTLNDFSTANYETYSSRLIQTVNNFHPIIEFLQYICIGNERYLTVWEPISQSAPSNTEYQRHRLVFPSGYEVNGLALWNEYLAICTERRSSSATNGFQDGKIFFWDGISTTYNFFIDISEGSPYGLYSHKNVLYYMADNALWAWSGGAPVLVFEMPNTNYEYSDGTFYSIMYPNSMTVFNRLLSLGFPCETNSQLPEHGIYTFGNRNRLLPESFGFDHTASSGMLKFDGSNQIRIGSVYSFGDKLFMAWRDDSKSAGLKYGVDVVDANSDPYATAEWRSLQIDNGAPHRTKQANDLVVSFAALPTGCTVTPKYKIDRESSWQTGTAAVAGDTEVRFNINKRYKDIQVGLDLVATTTTPQINSVVLIYDLLASEVD